MVGVHDVSIIAYVISEGDTVEKTKLALSKAVELGDITPVGDVVELPKSTLLAPGTFNGITFLAEEINTATVPAVMPLTLNHSRDVDDEVGFFKDVTKEDGKIRAVPVINLETTKGAVALGYVKNRMKAGLTPNLSVELWATIEDGENGEQIARDIEIVKASFVDLGACNPADGCGVGLRQNEEVVTLGVVPEHPWEYGKDENGSWSKPNLSDFTEKPWEELTDEEKRSIAGHYAWTPENPPARFSDMKLPHHKPGSHAVVWNGVRTAMATLAGARGGVDIPAGDFQKVYEHLAKHYREFNREPPELSQNENGEWVIKGIDAEEEAKDNESPADAVEVQEAEAITADVITEDTPEVAEVDDKAKVENEEKATPEPPCLAEVEILTAQLEEATRKIEELKAKLTAYEEKERGELIAELKKYAPGFTFEEKSTEELRELVEFAHAIGGMPAKRKTAVEVQNDKPDPKAEFESVLDAKLRKLKKEV